jgi:F0F1-type ATP synthase membrane subunit b/b'
LGETVVESILKQLGINDSLFVLLLIVVILSWALQVLYLRPFTARKLQEEREQARGEEEARKALEEAARERATYLSKLAEGRQAVEHSRVQALAKLQQVEADMLNQARKEAREAQKQASAEMEHERIELLEAMKAATPKLRDALVQKLREGKG